MDVSRVIEAPHELLWEILVDTHQWPVWGPSIKSVRCPTRRIEQGAAGVITTSVGVDVRFEITHMEPMYRWDWVVAKVPATGHRLERVDERRSRVVFEIPGWGVLYKVVCQRALDQIERLVSD